MQSRLTRTLLFRQVFHICHPDGRQDSMLCPPGTIFNQKYFVCDWWYSVNCAESPRLYALNEILRGHTVAGAQRH